jgi:autotransporter-associated beta strand protein
MLTTGSDNANTTYAGNISDVGTLAKIGSGVLTLAGSNTYTGATTISQGVLLVNGSLLSPVTINGGGTLGGTGSVSSVVVSSSGHLAPGGAPGDAPGSLNFNGSLTLLSGAAMDYELDTPTDSDEVNMPSGLLNLNGQQFSDFNFTALDGFGIGDYTLIKAGAVSGSLGANTSGTIDGYRASIIFQDKNLVLNVVPEPGSFALAIAGGACALVFARRRRPAPTRRNWASRT